MGLSFVFMLSSLSDFDQGVKYVHINNPQMNLRCLSKLVSSMKPLPWLYMSKVVCLAHKYASQTINGQVMHLIIWLSKPTQYLRTTGIKDTDFLNAKQLFCQNSMAEKDCGWKKGVVKMTFTWMTLIDVFFLVPTKVVYQRYNSPYRTRNKRRFSRMNSRWFRVRWLLPMDRNQ